MFDEAETAAGRVRDALEREARVRLREEVAPVLEAALAAVEADRHDEICVSGEREKKGARVSRVLGIEMTTIRLQRFARLGGRGKKREEKSSQGQLLRPRRLRFLRQHHLEHQDARALPQRRDQTLEDRDAVRIAQVVEDPAEEVDILARDRLVLEEIVPRELDARLVLLRQHLAALLRRAGEVLYDELDVLRRVRQMLRHGAVPAPDVYQHRARPVERRPVVRGAGGQVLDVESLAFRHELHALAKAARALGLVGQEGVERAIRTVGDAVRRLVRLARARREARERLGHLHEGRPHLVRPHAHVVAELRVLGHHAAHGGVGDAARAGFGEDAVRHRVPEDAVDEGFGEGAGAGDVGVGGGAVGGHGFVDVVGVDYAEVGYVAGLFVVVEGFFSVFMATIMGAPQQGTHSRRVESQSPDLWDPKRAFGWSAPNR